MSTLPSHSSGREHSGHRSLTLSRAALAGLVVVFGLAELAGIALDLPTQAAVYLVGMVAVNLPHGGYEHVANLRRRALAVRARYVAAYLVAVAAFLGLFLVAPVAGLALAVSVACAKGGLGGLGVLDATTGTDHLRARPQRLLAAAVRGGAVMIVPLVVQPGTFYTFSAIMVGMFDPGALALNAAQVDLTRAVLGGGFGLAAVAHVGLGYARGGGRSWLVDAGETALRAWLLLAGGALATGLVVAAVWWAAPNPLGNASLLPGLVAFWSVAISIVALPHVVVGSVLDRDRGIWYVP